MPGSNEKRTLSIRATLVDEISRQLGGIRDEVKKVADRTQKANERSARSWAALRKAVAAVAAAYAAVKVVGLTRELNQATEELVKVANATGESIERMSELRFAFREAGGNAEQFRAVMSSLATAQGAALEGSVRQVAAFEKLGVNIEALRTAGPVDVFREMSRGITDLNEGSEQYLELVKLFPEQWRNVINLIGRGTDAFDESLEDARRAGATITREQARAAVQTEKAFRRVETAIQSVARELVAVFGPTISNALDAFAKALLNNRETIKQIAEFTIRAASAVARVAIDAAQVIANTFEGLKRTIRDVSDTASELAEAFTFGAVSRNTGGGDAPSERLKQINAQIEQVERGIRALDSSIERNRRKGIEPSEKRLEIYEREIRKLKELREARVAELPVNQQLEFARGRLKGLADEFFTGFGATGGGASAASLGSSVAEPVLRQVQALRVEGTQGIAAFVSAGIEQAERLRAALEEALRPSFADGLSAGLRRLTSEVDNFENTAGQLIGSSVSRAVDNLSTAIAGVISGANSMREAFRAWAQSTLQLIAQVISRLLVLRTISLFTGGSTAGSSTQTQGATLSGGGAAGATLAPATLPAVLPAGAGGGTNVTLNVFAWDSRDAARGLVENRDTIRALFQDDAARRRDVRQTIQKAAR